MGFDRTSLDFEGFHWTSKNIIGFSRARQGKFLFFNFNEHGHM